MDVNYIVRTHREGTLNTDSSIEETLNNMGQDALKTRTLGSVVAIVEKAGGKITKSTLRWAAGNDPKFQGIMQKNADTLLAQTERLVDGGGDDNDIRVKFVGKK
jgi:hypothetical protein